MGQQPWRQKQKIKEAKEKYWELVGAASENKPVEKPAIDPVQALQETGFDWVSLEAALKQALEKKRVGETKLAEKENTISKK